MLLRVEVKRVQQIEHLTLELDISEHKLTCIVGKNGVGKTTLVKALRNLSHSDTFVRTAARGIFCAESSISYTLGGESVQYTYDLNIDSLNCKTGISSSFRELCAVELSVPHGERFNFFQSVSEADHDIRRQIILEEYSRPDELIGFLADIYSSLAFDPLVETRSRGRSYYCIAQANHRYIREDYLSSGEYFLISLYRAIKSGARLIVVDELDLSLDAAAQVHLLWKLREFCIEYKCSILFTTHSLAMMRTLEADELLYMERHGSSTELLPASYSYIKTLLFGFAGWDRYILTEDVVLHDFLTFIIQRYCKPSFFSYKIIYVGGGNHVASLLLRNRTEKFLADTDSAIAILDGDLRDQPYARQPNVYCLPIESVEKALFASYAEDAFPFKDKELSKYTGGKDLFNSLQRNGVMTLTQIHTYLCVRHESDFEALIALLNGFLSRPK